MAGLAVGSAIAQRGLNIKRGRRWNHIGFESAEVYVAFQRAAARPSVIAIPTEVDMNAGEWNTVNVKLI